MEYVIPALVGIGLSAACGFRIFVPPFILSLASQLGYGVPLGDDLAWLGSWPATVLLGAAVLAETGAYFIPFVDNLLDTVSTPAAVVAGSVLTAGFLGELDPALKWGVALIAGGGLAGVVQVGSAGARAVSTATTGGLGNPLVSGGEAGGAVGLSILAIALPLLAFLLVLLVLSWAIYRLVVRARRKPPTPA